jgi:hypothetical protein
MDPVSIAFGLAQYAPSIVKWISGSDKAEAAAETVINIAKTVTGRDTGEAALNAITADPALVLQFRQSVLTQEADLDKAYLADRQDARNRDLKLRESGDNNVRANMMILGDVVGLLACLLAMVYVTWLGVHGAATGDSSAIIMALNGPLGMLTQQFANGLRDAHQFEFGSSRGSITKQEQLFQLKK